MDINDPTNSRTLAILIQNIRSEDRDQFIEDAKSAASMESFMKGVPRYKTIPLQK